MIHTDRIVFVFPIAAKNRPAAASLQTLEITESGREIEDVVPLDIGAIGDYAQSFSLGLLAERDAAIAERDAAIEALADQREAAETALGSQRATMQGEIDRLKELIPPPLPPRTLYPRELLGRFTFAEVVAAIRTDDDAAIYAVANLQTTVAPINLDSDETRTLIGALVVAKIITAERLAEIFS